MVEMGTMNRAEPARKFQFIAGRLCLDFCNTVGGKRGATTREYLNSYADLVSWAEQAGLLDQREAEALLRKAGRSAQDATAVVDRAIGLREALYRIFLAILGKKTPPAQDLALLNAELARTL